MVIGETAVTGNRVRLYQAITLGAKIFPNEADDRLTKGIARHPIVEDDVVIYAGAAILARVTIGVGSVIGGNVWITDDESHFTTVSLSIADLSRTGNSDCPDGPPDGRADENLDRRRTRQFGISSDHLTGISETRAVSDE